MKKYIARALTLAMLLPLGLVPVSAAPILEPVGCDGRPLPGRSSPAEAYF